jgi:hypothetical protein
LLSTLVLSLSLLLPINGGTTPQTPQKPAAATRHSRPAPPTPLPSFLAGAILGHQLTVYADAVAAAEAVQAGAAYVGAVQAQEAAQRASERVSVAPVTAPRTTGVATASDAWFAAISQCESGGTNGWRTGYFGIEAGYPIGGMSYAEQLAWARRILAQSGPSAWGCWAAVGGPY